MGNSHKNTTAKQHVVMLSLLGNVQLVSLRQILEHHDEHLAIWVINSHKYFFFSDIMIVRYTNCAASQCSRRIEKIEEVRTKLQTFPHEELFSLVGKFVFKCFEKRQLISVEPS